MAYLDPLASEINTFCDAQFVLTTEVTINRTRY